jgi:hypothetical protein
MADLKPDADGFFHAPSSAPTQNSDGTIPETKTEVKTGDLTESKNEDAPQSGGRSIPCFYSILGGML